MTQEPGSVEIIPYLKQFDNSRPDGMRAAMQPKTDKEDKTEVDNIKMVGTKMEADKCHQYGIKLGRQHKNDNSVEVWQCCTETSTVITLF